MPGVLEHSEMSVRALLGCLMPWQPPDFAADLLGKMAIRNRSVELRLSVF